MKVPIAAPPSKNSNTHNEDVLRPVVETSFHASRTTLPCPSCKRIGTIGLSSAAGRRRFQCLCKKSWGVAAMHTIFFPPPLLTSNLPSSVPIPAASSTYSRPGKRMAGLSEEEDMDSPLSEEPSLAPCYPNPAPLATSLNTHLSASEQHVLEKIMDMLLPFLQQKSSLTTAFSTRLSAAMAAIDSSSQSPKSHHSFNFPSSHHSFSTPNPPNFTHPPNLTHPSNFIHPPYYPQSLLSPSSISLSSSEASSSFSSSKYPFSSSSTITSPNPSHPHLKPTFAEIAGKLGIADSEHADARVALAALRPKKQQISPGEHRIQPPLNKLKTIYVTGFQRMAISEVKKYLFTLRFTLSKIINISFIGQSTIEFLIFKDYVHSFHARCSIFGWKVLPEEYDPSKPSDPKAGTNSEISEKVRSAFLTRIKATIVSSSRPIVKEYFSTWYSKISGSPYIIPTEKSHIATLPSTASIPAFPTLMSDTQGNKQAMIEVIDDYPNLDLILTSVDRIDEDPNPPMDTNSENFASLCDNDC